MKWEKYGILCYKTKSKPLLGKIKLFPEDFIVEEIPIERKEEKGDFIHFTLIKKNWNTVRALRAIAKKLGVGIKRFGWAGNKDKFAITSQRISVWKVKKEKLEKIKIKDIELKDFQSAGEKIKIGDLIGNKFTISIREIPHSSKEIFQIVNEFKNEMKNGIPNFFGPQRFGIIRPINHLVGKEILKGNFERAVKIILCYPEEKNNYARKFLVENWKSWNKALEIFPKVLDIERRILNHLSKYPNDFIGSLRKISRPLRKIFVHSYQSYIFNLSLSKCIMLNEIPKELPIVGYNSKLDAITKEVLKKEGIKKEQFRIKSMPELSEEGTMRKTLFRPKNFKVLEIKDNFLKICFELEKGCFATILLRELMKCN